MPISPVVTAKGKGHFLFPQATSQTDTLVRLFGDCRVRAECPIDVRLATTGAQAKNKTPSSRSEVFNFEELDAGGYLSESILSVS